MLPKRIPIARSVLAKDQRSSSKSLLPLCLAAARRNPGQTDPLQFVAAGASGAYLLGLGVWRKR